MTSSERSNREAALVVASLSAFMAPFMGSSVNIALPAIGAEFHLDAILLGWVATSYLLAAAVFLLPAGKIADIWGRRRVFLIGIIIYTLFSAACALAPTAGLLLLFRVLQGVGSAMIFGTGVAILTSVYPGSERGRVLGVNVAFTYAGLSLGPVLGGLLTEQLGWRSIFWSNVPLGIVAAIVTAWRLRGEWAEARGERFDLVGALVAALALAALMYGFSLLPGWTGFALIAFGIAALAGFAAWENRTADPLLSMQLFRRNRVFAFSNLAALIHYSATFALTFFLSLYLQYIKGFGPEASGLILIAQPALMAIVSPIAGRLSDRFAPRTIASIGMGMIAVMLALLSLLDARSSVAFIVGCLVVVGIGYALFSSPNSSAIMGSAERRQYGVASATMGTMRLVGQMLSMGIALLIIALHLGDSEITPALYPRFIVSERVSFIIFAVLCVGGVFASLARGGRVERVPRA